MQNHAITHIRISDGEVLGWLDLDFYGTTVDLYRVKDGHVIYGEEEIAMFTPDFQKAWGVSGADISAFMTGWKITMNGI